MKNVFDVCVCVCSFQLDLGPRPEVQRKGPVTMEEWEKYQDSEGRMTNVPHIKDVIFKGVRYCFEFLIHRISYVC